MIRIKVPATSANFCIGFDTLGVALSIYNEYTFDKSDYDFLEGFENLYMNENNLVLTSYKKFFDEFNIPYIPVKIKQIKQNIPNSRGLGSSAACIVAGILAANKLSEANFDKEKLLSLACQIEGHPDNVAPCLLGGFVASIVDERVNTIKYKVSSKLKFNVFIPNFKLSTEEARKVLPETYSRCDVVHNLSRMAFLSDTLKNGNFETLKLLLDDKIHEPYRIKLIPNAIDLKDEINKEDAVLIISGSGSTMLSISLNEVRATSEYFKKIKVKIDNTGSKIYD